MWKLALPTPFTKIFAYVGTSSTDISMQGTYTVDYNPNSPSVSLNSPPDNSIDNPPSINFIWKKDTVSVNYIFQLFSDSLLTNNILTDTIHNNTDTFKTKPEGQLLILNDVTSMISQLQHRRQRQ
ncbi:MAG: hypothetical protein IPI04_14045 [Ignavibacteria bacterium]|nr:hypothetical protein [Ignavibacteria bacterium]